ncbi:MAG: glycosyltransferase [Candidatus Marinimicrobia bacterium]|nr:glycosyltransferase [Candidatus Neomarinimicrobiota bacterium]MCF7880226.1 glycosyltransferase [Candidatus Neomarinimicrobiota bacterium]
MASPRLSIVIVNYNVKEFLEQSLQAIRKASVGLETEVIVVDNHSVDGSAEMLRSKFSWVTLITNDENRGFAVASNQGIRASTGEYVLLLNPDTLVQEDTFTSMINYLDDHPDVGMAGCKILNPDGSLQLACRRSFPTIRTALPKILGLDKLFPRSRIFARYNLTYLDPDEITDVDAVSGSFMMVRRAALDEVGLLDETFFMYGEDLDWCYRFNQAGWIVRYLPITKIIHYKGESSKFAPFDSYIAFYRAMDLFVKKHFSRRWTFIFNFFIRIGIFMRGSVGLLASIVQRFAPQLADGLLILVGFVVAILIKFGDFQYILDYSFLPLVYTGIWLGSLTFTRAYTLREFSIGKALSGLGLGFVVISALTFFFNQFAYSRAVLVLALLFSAIALPAWRIIVRRQSGNIIGKPVRQRRAAIVGAGNEGGRIYEKLRSQLAHGYEIVGFIDDAADENDRADILGASRELPELVRVHNLTDVIFTSDVYRNIEILGMVDQLKDHRVELKIVPHSLEFILGKATVEDLGDIPLVELDFPLSNRFFRVMKRMMDVGVALAAIPVLIPICFTVAAIKGYRLKREVFAGIRWTEFRGRYFTDGNNSTGFCKKTPLLWNILKGNMSLVGVPLHSLEERKEEQLFKPGIFSLWGIESDDPDEQQQYNQYYMQHYSLSFDLQILFRGLFDRILQ